MLTDEKIIEFLKRTDNGNKPTQEEIDYLGSIKSLDLHNSVSELPYSVSLLTSLERLSIYDPTVTILPESIGGLTSLKRLTFYSTSLTLLPNSIGNLRSLVRLDLQNAKLKVLPKSIENLSSLEILNLGGTEINSIPSSVGRLRSLKKLDLSGTNIVEIPETIGELSSLEILNLHRTPIRSLPITIGRLRSLKTLDLAGTNIVEIPETIGNLSSLEYLDLHITPIRNLPNSIGKLSSLQFLSLSKTSIRSIPDSIGRLSSLDSLYLENTLLTQLPESIGNLELLAILKLDNTLLSVLPNSIMRLSRLTYLGLAFTKITELPENGWDNLNLHTLDLSGLLLNRIPKSLALTPRVRFSSYHGFPNSMNYSYHVILSNTHLIEQNIEVFLHSPILIPGLYSEDLVRINECKVIFLGDGDSGKSYTIKRIKNLGQRESAYYPYETKETPGVEISDFIVKSHDNLCIHFWDFGGQELLHSMHRCFLTEKTCYVVTVKSRETKGSERATYWLRNITAFAPDSPILLFINCWDNDTGERVIDEPRIRREFPNIKDVIYCSAKTSTESSFNETVTSGIIDLVERSGYLNTEVNRKWNNVRLELLKRASEDNYLTKNDYHNICSQYGIENEQNADLLTFFNNLGVCFSYHLDKNKKELAEYKLLDPKWLTNAVYAIIEEGMDYANNGKISIDSINHLLCKPVDERSARRTEKAIQYLPNECKYVLDVAAANNLCYRINNSDYFFPALCHQNSPDEALNFQTNHPNAIEYRFKYTYLPDSVIHRLNICLQKEYDDIVMKDCWLKGMIIRISLTHELLIQMDDDKNLNIIIYSDPISSVPEIFSLIRQEILETNEFFHLESIELIAMNEDEFSLVRLLKASKRENTVVDGNVTGKEYDANDLLRRFYTDIDISRFATDGKNILTAPNSFHPADVTNEIVRSAILQSHEYTCNYCKNVFDPIDLMIDHIIPRGILSRLPYLHHLNKAYVKQLERAGFNLEKPDYLENYCSSCYKCNNRKGSKLLELKELRELHERAAKKVPFIKQYISINPDINSLEQIDKTMTNKIRKSSKSDDMRNSLETIGDG